MDLVSVASYLAVNHRAVAACHEGDGNLYMAPVFVGVSEDGCATLSSRENARLVGALEATGQLTLCAFTQDFMGEWLRLAGPVRIIYLPEAMPMLRTHCRQVYGEHHDWTRYETAMAAERRVLIKVEPHRLGPGPLLSS